MTSQEVNVLMGWRGAAEVVSTGVILQLAGS